MDELTVESPRAVTQSSDRRLLRGWGRTAPSVATLTKVLSAGDVAVALADAPKRGIIARGLGRSYGDLAQNAGGVVLDMTGFAEIVEFDRERGVVTVQGGCSLGRLLERCLPAGWFLPVTPGTRHVTVGGAIACDVHGKNHHRDGSFGSWVLGLSLMTPAGAIVRLDPVESPSQFWATVGGLGLTGVVLEATVQLLAVETPIMSVDTERTAGLERTIERLRESDAKYRYSVAWIDLAASASRFGRAVLIRGNHARSDELPPGSSRGKPGAGLERLASGSRITLPGWFSAAALLRRPAAVLFNEAYYRRARNEEGSFHDLTAFFYPLDAINNWNQLYGRGGFLQYQFVLPFGAEEVMERVLRRISSAGGPPLLAVLKQLGPSTGPLSFPLAGWTATLDLKLPAPELVEALDRADEEVAAAGGRVYLAKDSRLRPELLGAMYPRLGEWRKARAALDPTDLMRSDLARRLLLTGGPAS